MSQSSRGTRGVAAGLALTALAAGAAHAPRTWALDPALAITQYSHRAWLSEQSEDSLPQNSVFSIVQTRDGYLWLATQEGLVRFDGVRFEVFNQRNTTQIRHNDVWRLLETRDGSLWIGTRGGGLTRYRDGRFTHLSKEDGLSDNTVQSLWEDPDGSLWIGTRGGGLNHYQDGRFTVYRSADGLASDTVYALCRDADGVLWIGTDGGGLTRYRDGHFSTLDTRDGLSHDTVYALHAERDAEGKSVLWVGTGNGLNRIRDGRMEGFRVADGLSNDNIRAIHRDRAGNLWIGTDGGGLNRYQDGRFSAFTSRHGLPNDSIGAIVEDREGNLWVGTDAGGLNRFRDNKFVTWGSLEGLSNDNARSILEDREGNLWIGTFGGLNRFRDGRFTVFGTKDGLSSDVVLSILQDRDGSLWLGTLGGGLNHFKDGHFTVLSVEQGLSNDTVLALLQDRDGALWIGTRTGGLNRYENGRFRVYGADDGFPARDVRYLHQDRHGDLWIGTLGNGLVRYRDGRFQAFTSNDGLSNERILAIHEDADGVLWIGTFGGGLNRYKDGRFTAYTARDGLFDDSVFHILEDAQNRLWMSSNRGVYRVDKRELDDFAAGRRTTITSVAYGKSDGMRSNEGNGAHQPAGWKTRDGRLWFPTIQGMVTIDPENIRRNEQPPPVRIERALADGQAIDLREGVALAAGTRKFEFHYSGLSYQAPEKVQFRYRLEGFDPDWVDAGGKRIAYYTNIPPGHYRFRVLAANNDAVWNPTGAALAFRLQPYFYQTPAFSLFYIVCGGALVALALWFHRLRVRRLQARERELLQLMHERQQAQDVAVAANRVLEQRNVELARSNAELERFAYVASHDLQEPLRSIVGFTQLLARKYEGRLDAQADEYIRFAVDAARSMRTRIDNLLAYARAGASAGVAVEGDCERAFEQAMAHLHAALADSGAVVTHTPLPRAAAQPDELLQLFQNLLDNAIKFRAGGRPRIHISAERAGDDWQLCVSDNGIGIEPRHREKIFGLFQRLNVGGDYPGTGIGLAMCKKIVEERGGRIWVESEPGQGSRFCFTLPALRIEDGQPTGSEAQRSSTEPAG